MRNGSLTTSAGFLVPGALAASMAPRLKSCRTRFRARAFPTSFLVLACSSAWIAGEEREVNTWEN